MTQRQDLRLKRYECNGDLIAVNEGSSGFQKEGERFERDIASQLKEESALHRKRKEQIYNHKREEFAKKEEERWAKLKEMRDREEKRWENKRALNPSKKNISSVNYNLIAMDQESRINRSPKETE